MSTFSERLLVAIEKRKLSQAQAAKRCGISQQSINYIVNKKLKASKLGPQIASALQINPDWLIYGKGKFEETKVFELPIIHSAYMLNKYFRNEIDENTLEYTVTEASLGPDAFAYLIEPKKMAICYQEKPDIKNIEYLTIKNSVIAITRKKGEFSFPIYEWRTRHDEF